MMPSWLCDPRFFAAWAVTADGDADLPDGTHLRLAPSTALGMPLAPFLLWDVEPVEIEISPTWFAGERTFATADLDAGGGSLLGWPTPSAPLDARLAGVEARFHGGDGEVALVQQTDAVRVTCARSERRWLVASPKVSFVRLRGSGTATVHGWGVSTGRSIEALLGAPPVAALSAPVDPGLPWYADGEGPELALQRVADGAPRRWTPPDRPDGPLDLLPPAAEVARLEAFRATLDDEVQALFGDPRTLPSRTTITQVIPGEVLAVGGHRPWQRLTNPVLSTLLMKAMDPGAARYLGLMTTLPNPERDPNPFLPPPTRAILAAGLFACPAETDALLPAPDGQEQQLMARLLDLQPGLQEVADVATRVKGVVLRALATSALIAPSPDPVEAPVLTPGDRVWLREPVGPSTAFRQQIQIEAAPLAPLVAVGRLEPGGWVSRHEMVDVDDGGGGPARRAAARMVGTVTTGMNGRYGILTESELDLDGAPWRYRVALGDLFGRFGPTSEILLDHPPPPVVPTPAVRAQLSLGAIAAGDAPASPGSVRATVSVPAPHRLTAGSRALSRVVADLDGVIQDTAAPAGDGEKDDEVAFDFELPALVPLESRVVTVSAHFAVDDGTVGPSSTTRLTVTDGRSPPIPPTGIGIVWSSRPSPATDVEFRLRFTGTPQARYRVYLTDARGLDLPVADGVGPFTRAEIAVSGARLGLDGVGRRHRFRLLTEPALEAGPDGVVRFDTRLPRSLETVQFLRFVPVGARNSEAPFESCPLLPIAVPSDRRPPAPRISSSVDAATGIATLEVTAAGLDLVALKSAEPGLFDLPVGLDAKPPEYRLRRASGTVPDALYAREIGRGVLSHDGESFVASIDDSPSVEGLVPYVRYFYWAEVRHPAERRVPRGVLDVALPVGAIVPDQPAQREDAPASFSAPSAPVMAMHVPAEVATLLGATVSASAVPGALPDTFTVTVQLSDGPLASARAQPGFTMQLHWQVGDSSWTPVPGQGEVNAGAMTTAFDHASADPATRLALILVDPVGRKAAPLMVDVVAG